MLDTWTQVGELREQAEKTARQVHVIKGCGIRATRGLNRFRYEARVSLHFMPLSASFHGAFVMHTSKLHLPLCYSSILHTEMPITWMGSSCGSPSPLNRSCPLNMSTGTSRTGDWASPAVVAHLDRTADVLERHAIKFLCVFLHCCVSTAADLLHDWRHLRQ